MAKDEKQNLEDAFQEFFQGSVDEGGDQELVRAVEKHTLQLSGAQIKILLWLKWTSVNHEETRKPINEFINLYLDLKHHNGSKDAILKAVEAMALRKFINANSIKIALPQK